MTNVANDHLSPADKAARGVLTLLSYGVGLGLGAMAFVSGVNVIAGLFGAAFFDHPFLTFVACFSLFRFWWSDTETAKQINFSAMKSAARAAAQEEAAAAVKRHIDFEFAERVKAVIRDANARGRGWYTPDDKPPQ